MINKYETYGARMIFISKLGIKGKLKPKVYIPEQPYKRYIIRVHNWRFFKDLHKRNIRFEVFDRVDRVARF